IGEAAVSGELDLVGLRAMPDARVIERLSSLPGIGVWTAEMLLIFSLCRPDVVSWGDLAIRRGMMNLYGLKDLSREQFDRFRKRYSPCGSVASLYLWALSAE
ncbi:MAG: DNA-3-methyladenine glycosylase 2 family protein, partial [Desulfobacterales bacterium]|nr:DNA-3-methyladenine glycosylase 2 family protein [Desulfobacterales bacterium]